MIKNAQGYALFKGISEEEAQKIAGQITYTDDAHMATEDADLVIESITENFEIKKAFYQEFGEAAPDKTIFGTNTSGLLPSQLMAFTGRPEKYVGLHFSNPVWEKPIVEVMGTSKTNSEIVEQMVDFAHDMKMTPVVAHKERPGYLLNSLLIPWLEGSQQLLADGIATPEDIDKTWMAGAGDHTGPIGVQDLIGLDTVIASSEGLAEANPDQKWRAKFVDMMKKRRDDGRRGIVDGKGFYTYPNPEYRQADFFDNDPAYKQHSHPYHTVTVAGGGVLGSQIAYQIARFGFDTIQYDISEETIDAAKKRVESYIPLVVRDVDADPDEARAAADRITYTANMEEAFSHTDLVIEAVPETMAIKKQFYNDIQRYLPEHTVLLTNSSTLAPSAFMHETGRPEKFLALHFVNHIWLKNTGEVMKTELTDDEVFKDVQSFTDAMGMMVISLYKEQPGYILNTLFIPFLRGAIQLLATGVATPRDIDLAWKVGRNIPYGPCQAIDRVSIRTLYNIYLAHYANTSLEADEKALALLERLEKAGELGQETGMGLYEYRDGETIDREWNL